MSICRGSINCFEEMSKMGICCWASFLFFVQRSYQHLTSSISVGVTSLCCSCESKYSLSGLKFHIWLVLWTFCAPALLPYKWPLPVWYVICFFLSVAVLLRCALSICVSYHYLYFSTLSFNKEWDFCNVFSVRLSSICFSTPSNFPDNHPSVLCYFLPTLGCPVNSILRFHFFNFSNISPPSVTLKFLFVRVVRSEFFSTIFLIKKLFTVGKIQ